MMLEGAGFEVVDLGVDVAPETFVASVREQGIQIVCMSALLTTTMASLQTTVEAIKAAGLTDNVRVMIGGAPITQEYADKIGAHGYVADAATEKARELIAEMAI
jgi:5-methyltetrahydrofolate--homocysteine methyltransferase